MAFWCCASIAALHVSLPACRCVVSWSLNSKKAKFSKPLADRKNCSWRYTLGSKHREPSTLPAQQLPVCLVLKLATRTTVDYRSCGCVLCSACTGSADSETGLYNLWHAVVWAGFPQSTSKAISSYDANEVLSDDAGGHWWPNRAEVRAEELTVVFEIMGNDAFDAYLAYEDDAHNEAVQLAICISYYEKDILKRVGEVPEG